jgi:hypothetical protein
MAENTTTVSLPLPIRVKGKKAAKEIFGHEKALSTYISMLISEDCAKRKIE